MTSDFGYLGNRAMITMNVNSFDKQDFLFQNHVMNPYLLNKYLGNSHYIYSCPRVAYLLMMLG